MKKTLKEIIDKWTRVVTDIANDYNVSNEDIVSNCENEFVYNVFREIERRLLCHWMIIDNR